MSNDKQRVRGFFITIISKICSWQKGTLLAGSNSVEYNGMDWITKLVNMPFFYSRKVDFIHIHLNYTWNMLLKATEMRVMYKKLHFND